MKIVPVPCLSDNYAYLVIGAQGRTAAVDPSEADPVLQALAAEGRSLSEIWLTHHHWDHVGGIERLVDEHGVEVVRGSAYDLDQQRIPRQTIGLAHDDGFQFDGADVRVLSIPGHTLGAVAYVTGGHLFSGDTLFLAGCGRVFEGTMPMMANSLRMLRDLPPETKVWCGHEYTVDNLRFAASVDPENQAVTDALKRAKAARAASSFTVPGTIAGERETNPFFRFDQPPLLGGGAPDDAFARVRKQKDSF